MFSAAFLIFRLFSTVEFKNVEKILLLIQLATTVSLTGVIWIVQIVHYPLFGFVGEEKYRAFHLAHMNLIAYVVAPLMIAEALSAALIVFYPPANADAGFLWLGVGLVVVVWLSTFFLQVPLHERLAANFDQTAHAALVNTNWIRTVSWTLRSVIVLNLVWRSLK